MDGLTLGERLTARRDAPRGNGEIPDAVKTYVETKITESETRIRNARAADPGS